MDKAEADRRAAEGQPIETARELVFALQRLQNERAPKDTRCWYLMNRYIRAAMEIADEEEQEAGRG